MKDRWKDVKIKTHHLVDETACRHRTVWLREVHPST